MRMSLKLLVLALAVTSACATTPNAEASGTPRGDSKTVTETELASATQINLYDYLAAERPRWLEPRAFKSRSFPVTVFMDDARLGDPSSLKTLGIAGTKMIRYYEASAAQQKFNGRDIGPVIHVITK
jgi:hypothetical protein